MIIIIIAIQTNNSNNTKQLSSLSILIIIRHHLCKLPCPSWDSKVEVTIRNHFVQADLSFVGLQV